MKLDVPYFRQEKSTICGPACMRMVLAYNGIEQSEGQLEDLCETSWLGNTCEELASGSQELGLSAEVVENLTQDGLEDFLKDGIPLIALLDPAILYDGIRGFGHFVVITGLERGMVQYHDPDLKRDLCRNVDEFFKAWESCFFKGVKIWKSMRK